jgi:O-antigen ligase
MASRVREAIAPIYLFLCLTLGGSAQGIWQNMILQLVGLTIILWASWPASSRNIARPARELLVIAMLAIALIALQLVPLPASVWTHLSGRAQIAGGYRILGSELPALPLSLTPYRSLDSLFGLIPPLALFVAIVRLQAYRFTWLTAALLLGSIAGVVLGALQVTGSGNVADSHWYLYDVTNYGFATGFFANVNHMADLLVCTLPFLAAMGLSAQRDDRQWNVALRLAVVACTLLIVVGIALNRSLAVYGLAPAVLAASAALWVPRRGPWRRWIGIVTILFGVVAIGALVTSSVERNALAADASVQSRQEMLWTSAKALRDFLPWGSGLGSFENVYHLYEDPLLVNGTYVSHAHNDYVELALETGVPGILLMITFLGWWIRAAWRAWRYVDAGVFARAASIASAAILVHSLVDFPLRTAAISALFAMCLALLVERRAPTVQVRSDLRPARHIVVG